MVEAGLGDSEYSFALPTRGAVDGSAFPPPSSTNRSTELSQGGGIGGIGAGGFDFGYSLDGWEGWAEFGCPDKI